MHRIRGPLRFLARRSTYRSDWNLGKNNDGPELECFPTIWLIFSGISMDLVVFHGNFPAQCGNIKVILRTSWCPKRIVHRLARLLASWLQFGDYLITYQPKVLSLLKVLMCSPPTTGNPSCGEVMSCSPSAPNISKYRCSDPKNKPQNHDQNHFRCLE